MATTFSSLGAPLVAFVLAAATVWYIGVKISKSVHIIDNYFKLGQALGGMVFLAIVTNLPEIAIVIRASLTNNIALAVGNLLGGIAFQIFILVILDFSILRNKASITYKASSLQVALEGAFLMVMLTIVIMGAQLPKSLIVFRIAPGDIAITMCWCLSLWLINKSQVLPWVHRLRTQTQATPRKQIAKSTINIKVQLLFFILQALVVFIAGLVLEATSHQIADSIGMTGALFGATILAVVTALPELSTGFEAIKLKDYNLAMSDMIGGSSFLLVLLMLATLITGQSTLPKLKPQDIYLTCLAILLAATYTIGMIFRSKKQIAWMGLDSLVALGLYAVGMVGLFALHSL